MAETSMTEAMKILQECAQLQWSKAQDYQNPTSTVRQADYYFNVITTILDEVDKKRLRLKSLIEALHQDPEAKPNNESIEDTLKDMINYISFAAAWTRGKIPGQDPTTGLFNRKPRS